MHLMMVGWMMVASYWVLNYWAVKMTVDLMKASSYSAEMKVTRK